MSAFAHEISELIRRLEGIIRPGVIREVNYADATVRVDIGSLSTPWLPFFSRRAGKTSDWDPPEPGEQCLVLSPGGEPGAGIVLAGIYSDDRPAPSQAPELCLRSFEDGLSWRYDQKTHTLTLSRAEGLKIRIQTEELELEAKKVSIKGSEGELLSLLSEVLRVITASKTMTLMGAQPLMPAAEELPKIQTKLDSFRE